MSVPSFKAVASIVWVGGPKISIVLGLDHPYASLNWNILTETSSIVLCLKPVHFLCFVKILVHFLSPFHTKKSPPKLHKQLQKFYKVWVLNIFVTATMKYYDGTTMCWYYETFIGSHVTSMKQPWLSSHSRSFESNKVDFMIFFLINPAYWSEHTWYWGPRAWARIWRSKWLPLEINMGFYSSYQMNWMHTVTFSLDIGREIYLLHNPSTILQKICRKSSHITGFKMSTCKWCETQQPIKLVS